jgi:Tfp pilus assembly protein PilP
MSRAMRAHQGVLTSIGLVTVLGACGSSPPPPPPPRPAAAAPAQAPSAQSAPLVPVVPPEASVAVPKYEPKGRRDPFETLVVREGSGGLTVASTRLTGIVRSTRAALALIEAPDGIGYILKPGDTLGDGRLLEIGSDSVVFLVTAKAGAPANRVVLRLATN